jgi:ABC-type transporter lipoprotein component MlaA
LKNKDYAAAERGLQNARGEFARSEVPFQDLLKRQKSELDAQWEGQYRLIYQAADKSRALQSQVISLTETMLSQAKSSDEPALKGSIDKYEEIRAAYNQSDDDLQALLKQLAAMVRSH